MSALVLCDGGQSSLKAIEVAGFPGGLFMRQHDGVQLVVLHTWAEAAHPTSAAPATTAMSVSNAHGRLEGNAPGTAAAAVTASTEEDALAAGGGRAATVDIPNFQVLHSVLSTINESKSLRETLMYKIETAAQPTAAPTSDEEAENHVRPSSGSKRAESPRKTTLQSARAAKKKEPGPVGGVSTSAASSPSAPIKTPEELAEAHRQKHEAAQNAKASATVAYASSRLAHHGCHAVVLGVGNTVEGKSLVWGHTARCALQTWRSEHLLCFVKPDGFVPRRAAATTRLLVVVPVGEVEAAAAVTSATADGPHEQSSQEARGDPRAEAAAGAAEEASLEAGRAVVRYALRAAAARTAAATSTKSRTNDKDASEALPGSEGGAPPAASVESAAAAYQVGVLVVAAPEMDAAVVARFRQVFEVLLSGHATSSSAADVATPVAQGANRQADEEAGEETWAPVTVLTLKSSKQAKAPTIRNSAAQVARLVQQLRAEYALVADNAPAALHEALLCAVKPHCIVVPHVKY